MDATFVIHYSRPEYDSLFVKNTLETIFGLGFIEEVREIIITPTSGAPKFKKFYIYTIDDSHPALMRISDLIYDYTFAAIVYKYEYDRRTRKYVDRYWKVTHAPQLKTFTPYLMNEAQMEVFATIEPWAPEADAAFEPLKTKVKCDCESCKIRLTPLYKYVDETKLDEESSSIEHSVKEFPPPMVRDNEEPKGPFKMVRSVNSPPTKEEIEEEKAAAVNEDDYWREYWKFHTPPKLVRSTNEIGILTDKKETEFDELGAAIDKCPKSEFSWDNVLKPTLFEWDTREQLYKHYKTNCLL
jgi:hypothetical protein